MITENTKLNINGKTISMESFVIKYGVENMDAAILIANTLVKQGKATIVEKITEEERLIKGAIKSEAFTAIVDAINEEEESHKVYVREQNKVDNDLIKIGLDFATTFEAVEAEQWINSLGISDTEITMKKGAVMLKVIDITPQEYSKISRKFQTEKAIKNTVDMASKTMNGATDAVNYTATKVVAPIAKIAGEAGMNLGKGLAHTTVKVGSGLVNSGSKAIKDTKIALQTDPEMLRATRELRDAKDGLMSFFKSKMNNNKKRSGINILD